jgi:hypothetical protein
MSTERWVVRLLGETPRNERNRLLLLAVAAAAAVFMLWMLKRCPTEVGMLDTRWAVIGKFVVLAAVWRLWPNTWRT